LTGKRFGEQEMKSFKCVLHHGGKKETCFPDSAWSSSDVVALKRQPNTPL